MLPKATSTRTALSWRLRNINDAGGVLGAKIQVSYEDTKSLATEVPNVVRKLIEQDKVVALLGEVASSNSIAAAPVLLELKRPAIAPTSTNVKVTQNPNDLTKVHPYYFRACFLDPVQGTAMANFAYNKLEKTTAALIYNIGQDYNKGLAERSKPSSPPTVEPLSPRRPTPTIPRTSSLFSPRSG
jgi:branched-chain amino acid transport system substrate-binding protein